MTPARIFAVLLATAAFGFSPAQAQQPGVTVDTHLAAAKHAAGFD